MQSTINEDLNVDSSSEIDLDQSIAAETSN